MKRHAPYLATIWLICASPWVSASSAIPAQPEGFIEESRSIENVTRVYYPSQTMANKLSISFHQQLLMTNAEQGYLVVQLSEEDKTKLTALGFKLQPATQWITQRRQKIAAVGSQRSTGSALAICVLFVLS